jgi:hypothetical protein
MEKESRDIFIKLNEIANPFFQKEGGDLIVFDAVIAFVSSVICAYALTQDKEVPYPDAAEGCDAFCVSLKNECSAMLSNSDKIIALTEKRMKK